MLLNLNARFLKVFPVLVVKKTVSFVALVGKDASFSVRVPIILGTNVYKNIPGHACGNTRREIAFMLTHQREVGDEGNVGHVVLNKDEKIVAGVRQLLLRRDRTLKISLLVKQFYCKNQLVFPCQMG